VLVHGFGGSPEDFARLTPALRGLLGPDAVHLVNLHPDTEPTPTFNAEAFCYSVAQALDDARRDGGPVIAVGHSTGGAILLRTLFRQGGTVDLLVLAGVPRVTDGDFAERWGRRGGGAEMAAADVAALVTQTRRMGRLPVAGDFPVLLLSGENDLLVPCADALSWAEGTFAGAVTPLTIAGAGHGLFGPEGSDEAVLAVVHAASRFLPPAS
jgi:pimeloyl-ACP methyl ester carboxylesterase